MRYLVTVMCAAAVVSLSAQAPPPLAVTVGQTPPPPPPWDAPHLQFEVASVKVNKSGPNTMSFRTLPTSFTANNLPLRLLIQ